MNWKNDIRTTSCAALHIAEKKIASVWHFQIFQEIIKIFMFHSLR